MAISFFKRRWSGHKDLAEDFASFCMQWWVSQPHTITKPISFFAIDFLKKTIWKRIRTAKEDFTALEPDREKSVIDLLDELNLDQDTRLLVALHLHWGMSGQDIGDLYGLSKSRGCAKLAKALKVVREKRPDVY